MSDDVVAELDAELALIEELPYRVPIHLLAKRARDEIVALRKARDHVIPIGRLMRRLDPRTEGEAMMDCGTTRATGYYWILFNWPLFDPRREPQWQPASWDDRSQTWVVIGSRQELSPEEPCILAVDERRIAVPNHNNAG